ncbi:MAG: hypothetical protein ABUT39_03080 [Acidobacteriota bacterium]
MREQIHKLLPAEGYKWFPGVKASDHSPGCQYRIFISPAMHDHIAGLARRDRAAAEAEAREEAAGLGGLGSGDAEALGGVDPKPGEKGFRPSGSEYVSDGPTGDLATAPALPAEIEGPDMQALEGVGYYTMKLDYRIVGDNLAQLVEGFNYVDYHWERYEITSLVKNGLRAETEKAYRRTAPSQAAEVGSFEGTEGRAKHAVKKLSRDVSNTVDDLRHPIDSAYTGTATEVLQNLQANKLNLQLLPASAIVALGGTALGGLADLIGGKAQEREMTWPKEGYYLIRCIARPAPMATRTRAASVAVKVVEVRTPETLAKAGLDEPEAALKQAEFEVETAATPEEKARRTAVLEQQKVNATGSTLELLQKRRDSLEAERQRATGRSAERLREQVKELDAQIARLGDELKKADGEVLRPRLSLASEVTGQTYPLQVALIPLKREKNGPYEYKLVDVTRKGSEEFGGSAKTRDEAAWNAIRDFARHNGYGEGVLAGRFLNTGRTQVSPAQDVIPNVRTGTALARDRLNDLVTALVALGLLVPGVGEVAAVLGAAIAADRLYHRWSTGTLELDGEAVADLLGVVGALGMGATVLGNLKLVRAEKAFTVALKEADEVGLKAALQVIEKTSGTVEKIAKANELIGHAGMLVGNVNLFDQFVKIQRDELEGTLNHAEARRLRFEMLLGALRDNAVPLHLIRGEKPAKGRTEGAPAHETAPPAERPTVETRGEPEPGGRTTDPSPLQPGDPHTVKLGAGRGEKTAAFKAKLEALESQSKGTKDPAEREQIAKEAAAVDQELRTYAAERLRSELNAKGGGVEGLLSFLKPEEVRALRTELGDAFQLSDLAEKPQHRAQVRRGARGGRDTGRPPARDLGPGVRRQGRREAAPQGPQLPDRPAGAEEAGRGRVGRERARAGDRPPSLLGGGPRRLDRRPGSRARHAVPPDGRKRRGADFHGPARRHRGGDLEPVGRGAVELLRGPRRSGPQ